MLRIWMSMRVVEVNDLFVLVIDRIKNNIHDVFRTVLAVYYNQMVRLSTV